jgi:outer membrane protein TolC
MQVRHFLVLALCLVIVASASAQQLAGQASAIQVPQSLDQLLAAGQQSPFSGSVPTGELKNGVLELSVDDALTRGLKYNLGIVLSGQTTAVARADRLKDLSNILPHLDGNLREAAIKASLPAEGFSFSIPGLTLPAGIKFTNADARVSLTEDLFDLHAIENLRASNSKVKAAEFNFRSARETVTLAVAASYLLVISAESQVEAAEAELKTAEALQTLANDRETAGLTPNVDTLRARVEYQVRRQNLIEAHNNLAKQRITLLRVLGLPVHQQIKLVTRAAYKPLPNIGEADAFKMALAGRPDYLSLEQQVKAAELMKKSAQAERIPSLGVSGDYGVIGTHPSNAFATWTVGAGLRIPIFEGRKTEGDIHEADAKLKQVRAQRDDLRGRIEQDVADAMLDVNAAAEQVEVATTTVQLAEQTLTESRDRFSNGVTNNIEVIQAQEAMANAHQQYIASLYAHNIAKVLLSRALGMAEQTLRTVLDETAAPVAVPAR